MKKTFRGEFYSQDYDFAMSGKSLQFDAKAVLMNRQHKSPVFNLIIFSSSVKKKKKKKKIKQTNKQIHLIDAFFNQFIISGKIVLIWKNLSWLLRAGYLCTCATDHNKFSNLN